MQSDGRGRSRGGELGNQVVRHIADGAATCKMTPDADGITNYRECSRLLGLAYVGTTSIAGYGNLTVAFRSDSGRVHVKLHDVAHTPLLSYNLTSLSSLALKGHTYAGDKDGVTLKMKGKTVHFPLIGKLCRQYGYRPEAKGGVVDTACAVIAPGQAKAPTTPIDMQHLPLHLRPHTRGAAQENGGAARSQPQLGTPRVLPGVFNSDGATEAHRQVDAHQSR